MVISWAISDDKSSGKAAARSKSIPKSKRIIGFGSRSVGVYILTIQKRFDCFSLFYCLSNSIHVTFINIDFNFSFDRIQVSFGLSNYVALFSEIVLHFFYTKL